MRLKILCVVGLVTILGMGATYLYARWLAFRASSPPAIRASVPPPAPQPPQRRAKVDSPKPPASTPQAAAVHELFRLAPDDLKENDFFGTSVAIHGKRMLVGAHGDDDEGVDFGCAYVYELDEGKAWNLTATLRPAGIKRHIRFGQELALWEDIAVVAAEGAHTVYVFERGTEGTWMQTARLEPSDPDKTQLLGSDVSLDRNLLVIGAEQDAKLQRNAGAAYLFERQTDGSWRELVKLTSDDLTANDQFGAAVAISGKTVIVGSRHNDKNTGSAYVFQPDVAGKWRQVAKLKSPSADPKTFWSQFGIAVAVSGKTVLVGEWRSRKAGQEAGAAHVFEPDEAGQWRCVQTLVAADASPSDCFGYAVAIHEDRAVVGTLRHVDGPRCGSSYLFSRGEGGTWQQTAKLAPSDSRPFDQFGSAVTLSDNLVIVGAESLHGKTENPGAVYVFGAEPPPK